MKARQRLGAERELRCDTFCRGGGKSQRQSQIELLIQEGFGGLKYLLDHVEGWLHMFQTNAQVMTEGVGIGGAAELNPTTLAKEGDDDDPHCQMWLDWLSKVW